MVAFKAFQFSEGNATYSSVNDKLEALIFNISFWKGALIYLLVKGWNENHFDLTQTFDSVSNIIYGYSYLALVNGNFSLTQEILRE